MSTLKTHNLQSPDAGSVNIVMAPNAGMVVAGISTFSSDVVIPDKIIHSGDTNTSIRFPAADTIAAETGGSERLRIDSSGRLLAGAGAIANPKSSGAGSIDLDNQAFSIIVGGNHPSGGRSNNNAKTFRMSMVHYTLAEEPINILQGYCDSSDNNVYIGGGTGSANSLTSVRIYTGANTTTTGGTERFRIHSAGQIGLSGATVSYTHLTLPTNREV